MHVMSVFHAILIAVISSSATAGLAAVYFERRKVLLAVET